MVSGHLHQPLQPPAQAIRVRLQRPIQESPEADWKAVERGWCLGYKAFREELLAHARRGDHYGPELREADAVQAQGVVRAELRRRGWTEAELERRRKGDPEKVEMAWRRRQETTRTLKWIAQRFKMAPGRTSPIVGSKGEKKLKSVNSYDRPLI